MTARTARFAHPELIRPRLRGDDWCMPGEPGDPGRSCTAHREHHYCPTCVGWYGVPHDAIHGGPGWPDHPLGGDRHCACRPCRAARGEAE